MYVAGWAKKKRPVASLSFERVTEVVLFSLLPRADGSIDATTNGLDDAFVGSVKARAPRTLVAIGGERTGKRFRVPGIAGALAAFVKRHDLDGVVIDAEPLAVVPHETFAAFVHDVKVAIEPRMVVVAVAPDASEIARLGPVVGDVDRVTVMSYLGEPSPDAERGLVDALTGIGFAPSRISLGVSSRTPEDAARARIGLVGERVAGGLSLWDLASAPAVR